MSFITGLMAGILIAAGFAALEHYGSLIPPVGPFALSGNGALAATEILVPIAILWGWSWATNRWSGRSLIPTTLYTIGLALGVGAAVPIDAVFFPATAGSTLASAIPGLVATGTIFVLVPAIIAAVIYLPLKSGRIPTNAIVPAIGRACGDINPRTWSAVYGSIAMRRARLSAVVSMRWCLAHVPLLRRGSILPRSLMYRRIRPTSL